MGALGAKEGELGPNFLGGKVQRFSLQKNKVLFWTKKVQMDWNCELFNKNVEALEYLACLVVWKVCNSAHLIGLSKKSENLSYALFEMKSDTKLVCISLLLYYATFFLSAHLPSLTHLKSA